ncbi:MAG: thiamine pyrophosphate-dependent enzyme [Hyphomicrobiales bacterium]
MSNKPIDTTILKDIGLSKKEILNDYKIACESRQVSLLGRREVLTGKAKFGIFGDGKEIPQLAMSRVFKDGDWRSGYYRDQTFAIASGIVTLEELFSQLYGDTDMEANPGNGGRLMNNHFATRTIDEKGEWLDLTKRKNSSADTSPTASQMLRLVGLAQASKIYRGVKDLKEYKNFSNKGNEVAFGTIGDASTSEGIFFEAINAAGVLNIPMVVSVWDDGYGISVPRELQTTKNNISELLKGIERKEGEESGYLIYKAKAWDYPTLIKIYKEGVERSRKEHIPVLYHITECTQPQGHSTSGSHERYKSKERLKFEKEYDGVHKMRQWIIDNSIATEKELSKIEEQSIVTVKEAKKAAWKNFMKPMKKKKKELISILDLTTCNCTKKDKILDIEKELQLVKEPIRKDLISNGKKILRLICNSCSNPNNSLKKNVSKWVKKEVVEGKKAYSEHLYCENDNSALKVVPIAPLFDDDTELVPGREILRDNFDHILSNDPRTLLFGEDVGKIGGVNQTAEGLQEKYGNLRVEDVGIREATIIGQAIGLAMRGLRPIAEIQYFDYLLYALQIMSDDISTLLYRTRGGQKAPLIISTRGHRLEGIWHAGSPLSMVINSLRGMYICVPRNMTQAAGMYNTLLSSDDPALIIEPLNGYRIREKKPKNTGEYKIPLGIPEIMKEGKDITLVTYGSCVRIAQDAVAQLKEFDIDVELIDIQTLLPFDVNHIIAESIKKTNKVLFFDEDVPGGATAFMMQKVLDEQSAFKYLDSEPKTLSAMSHRAAYATDGDYFSNPNSENVFEEIYNIMNEYNPEKYPKVF